MNFNRLLQRVRRRTKILMAGVAVGVLSFGASGVPNIVFGATSPQQASLDNLQQTIDRILADPRLEGAHAGVLVRDADDGSVLYERNPDRLLVPASNNKLYSSSAALEILGGDYRFKTSVNVDGFGVTSTIRGNMYLKGTGDPTMRASEYDALAAEVAAHGITKITGNIVADDTFFDTRQLGYVWAWDSNPFYYQPEISALTVAADSNFNTGALLVEVTPAAAVGKPVTARTLPATSFVTFQNEAVTGPAGSANTLNVERKMGVNTIVISGSVPLGRAPQQVISTVSDPTGYAALLFKEALQRHGVNIDGQITRGATPQAAHLVTERQSAPLSQLLTPFMKLSNNGIAEILVKSMGRKMQNQGTWDAGLSVESNVLHANLGIATDKLQFVDGSGLSGVDFTTPRLTTDLLLAAQHEPWFQEWYDSLPIAGMPDPLVGGTLRNRMQNTRAAGNVHAKTGTLDNVTALSGYVTDADGKRLVFSIMFNNHIYSSAKPLEDAIAVALANFTRNEVTINQPQLLLDLGKKQGAKDRLECSWTPAGC